MLTIAAALLTITLAVRWKQAIPATQNERTFALIKPDAVAAGNAPAILKMIEDHGFTIVAKKEVTLDKQAAEAFYGVHKEKPFFGELVNYITSGPLIALVLQNPDQSKHGVH